jgi:hypothetical protein
MKRIPMERPKVCASGRGSRSSGVMSSGSPQVRELAARESDGLHVQLLWHPRKDVLTVSVEDSRAGERFQLAVARDRALDAFYHPFAYAA